ncbi:hypothetical protein BH11MYX4_BH11MYX4_16080 [soil metagenome]
MKASSIVLVTTSACAIALAVLACTADDPVLVNGETPAEGGASSGTSGTSGTSGSSGSSGSSGTSGSSGGDAAGAMLVFATSGEYGPDFGGVAGADTYCQGAARNENLPNALTDGSYLAWVATVASDAPAARFRKSSTGYKRTDGVLVAADWAGLVSGNLLAPINLTESRGPLGTTVLTWTNVAADGTLLSGARSCGAWTSSAIAETVGYGDATSMARAWTDSSSTAPATVSCNKVLRIYCFQQP